MNTFSVGAGLLASLAAVNLCCGENHAERTNRVIRIEQGIPKFSKGELCVLDGDLMFVSFHENGERPGGPGDPPLPAYSLHFIWDGPFPPTGGSGLDWPAALLKAKVAPRNTIVDREGSSQKLLARDGWYVTADLSKEPPQLILTEKPTQYSRWRLVDSPYGSRKFFKNDNAPGKAAWLAVGPDEKTYRGGIARKPILAEQKDYFWIGEADSGK